MQRRKILIVDDDAELVQLLERAFSKNGAEVYAAFDGREGLRQFYAHQPNLVILDVVMPVMDGWETCHRIRHFSDVPVIMLTGRTAEGDAIRGPDNGAVDYVTKPFSVPLLLARAQAALGPVGQSLLVESPDVYDDGHLRIDLGANRVFLRGEPVRLTGTEYRLLAYLLENGGRALTCQQILEAVWGREYWENVEYVHSYMWRLRRKLEADPERPGYLLTERGVGYRFRRRVARTAFSGEARSLALPL